MSDHPPPPPYPLHVGHPGAPVVAPPSTRVRPVDLTITVIELVLLGGAAALLSLLLLFLGAWADGLDPGTGGVTFAFALIVPTWVLWLVTLGVCVALLRRARLAFWVPLVALALWCAAIAVLFSAAG